MDSPTPAELPQIWRERAQLLRDWGSGEAVSRTWELAATELDQVLRSGSEETLTLVEAAKLSGYSADYLGDLVRQGKIPNAGRKGAPRVRRADLPTKDPNPRTESPRDISITDIADRLR